MFHKWKLRVKIVSLPAIVLLLLIISGLIAYTNLQSIYSTTVNTTDQIAPGANIASDLLENILQKRLTVEEYIKTGDMQYAKHFQLLATTNTQLAQRAKQTIQDPEQVKLLEEIILLDNQYTEAFLQTVVQNREKRDRILTEVMNVKGPFAEQSLTTLMETALQNFDSAVATHAGLALKYLLSAQLFFFKYLLNNQKADELRVYEALQKIQEPFQAIQNLLEDEQLKQNYLQIRQAVAEWEKGFQEIVAIIQARNEAIQTILNVNGPKIAERAEQLAASLWEDLHTNGTEVKESVVYTSNVLKGVGFLAVILSLLPAFLILRNITASIRQIVERIETLQRVDIAKLGEAIQSMAQGDLNTIVQGDTSLLEIRSQDEIGMIAQSLNAILTQVLSITEAFQKTQSTLHKLMQETKTLVQNAQAGKLDARGNVEEFQGGYRDLIQSINDLMEAIVAPINEAAAVLDRIAARDLSTRMHGEYQGAFAKIKESLNTAVANLDEALLQVAVAAEQVASASGQISAGSQTLAQGSSEQASSLEEVSSSLQEMSSMSRQNLANAQEARCLSDHTRLNAEKGRESMQRLSAAIDRIKASADETSNIVKTIDEIAFQTNLLALNAAVEAARAGEAGKGFAVVAEEVRNLAMRSAEAAKNTARMIEESVRNAENGFTLNHEVLQKLDEITSQAQKVSTMMAEITVASEQQNQGIEQINTAVEQLNQVTQQNAVNSEESASAGQELSGQAEMLQKLVNTFQLSNMGKENIPLNHQSVTMEVSSAPHQPRSSKRALVSAGRVHKEKSNGQKKAAYLDPKRLIPFDDEDTQTLMEF